MEVQSLCSRVQLCDWGVTSVNVYCSNAVESNMLSRVDNQTRHVHDVGHLLEEADHFLLMF